MPRAADAAHPAVREVLPFRAPLAWDAAIAHLAARATPGVETTADVDGTPWYWRTLALEGHAGSVGIGPSGDPSHGAATLGVHASPSLAPVMAIVRARLRRVFDLDTDVRVVDRALARDALLAPMVARVPGLRVVGGVDAFELALRAILGQQVSVRGATTLAGRLAARLGAPLPETGALGRAPAALTRLPVTATQVADAGVDVIAGIGLPRARAESIVGLARAVADGALPELAGDGTAGDRATFVERFTMLRGIGPWTASYVAMRALRDPDAFPEGDLALRKAAGGLSAAQLRARAEAWRPWRAYAAQHLWRSLA